MKPEVWKDLWLDNKLTMYEVSSAGNIRVRDTETNLKTHLSDKGYVRVYLAKKYLPEAVQNKAYLVHLLVLSTFKPILLGDEDTGNHKNKDKLFNDISNLEWMSRVDNSKHRHEFGDNDYPSCEDANNNVYSNEQINEVCRLLQLNKYSIPKISKKTGVRLDTINKIKARKQWVEISCKYNFPKTKPNANISTYTEEFKKVIIDFVIVNPEVRTGLIIDALNLEKTNSIRMLINRIRKDIQNGIYE